MILRCSIVVAALLGVALASSADLNPVHGQTTAENATTPTAQEGNRTIHFVTVGKATNNFYPNSINAQPGDIVSFQFYPTRHSVIKAAYGYPCVPYDYINRGGDMFYSGWQPVSEILADPPTWNLTINDTQPIFYYCGAKGSCIDWGMVGVINANASTSISTQIALAREASYQLIPGEPFPNEAQQASLASLAHTATTATLTVTATGAGSSESGEYAGDSHEHHGSAGLSSGAIAGIAVGAAVAGIVVAALAFLLCRTRALKKKLDEKNQQQQQAPTAQQYPPPFSPTNAAFYHDQSRHASQLPPYHGYAGQDMLKPEDMMSERSSTPMQTPYQMQGGFAPFQPGVTDPRFTQYTASSELTGNAPPVVELAGSEHGEDTGHRDYR